MNASNRVALNTAFLYGRMAVTVFLSLYTTRVTLDALGVNDFGIFNLVGGAITMLTFLSASMSAATQRFLSFAHGKGDLAHQRSIFNVSMVMHFCVALVVLLILEVAGFILFRGVLNIAPDRVHAAWLAYQFTTVSVVATIAAVPYDAAITANEHMLFYAVLGVVESVLKLGIALAIAGFAGDRLVIYSALTMLLTLVLIAVRGGYCHRKYSECRMAIRSTFDAGLCREMASFGSWSLLGSSTSMLAFYGQAPLFNAFFGPAINAAHGIAGQVNGQVSALAVNMSRALSPMIVKSEGAGDRKMMLAASFFGSKISFSLLLFVCVPVVLETPYIFHAWLHETPQYAVVFCQMLLLKTLIEQLFVTFSNAVGAAGRIRGFQLISAALFISPLIATYFLFSAGHPPPSLYFAFLSFTVLLLFAVAYFCEITLGLPMKTYMTQLVVPCVGAAVLLFGASMLPQVVMKPGLPRLIAVSAIDAVLFVPALWLLILSRPERAGVALTLHAILARVGGALQRSTRWSRS